MSSASDKDLLLSRSQDLEWVDDVSEFQCVRCDRVLIHHYISNCGHKFCLNCKKLVDDGSKNWRCPIEECKKIIEDVHLQDVNFELKVYELKVHCPNHKYGCPFVGQLKDVGGHLKTCMDTREMALPVILDGNEKLNDVLKQMWIFKERLDSISVSLTDAQKLILAYDRKWVDVDSRINEVASSFQELSSKLESLHLHVKETRNYGNENHFEMKQFQAEIALLKKKLEESEKEKRIKEALKMYNSVIRPEVRHLRIVNDYYKQPPTFTWIVNDVKSLINGSITKSYSDFFRLRGFPHPVRAIIIMYGKSVLFYLFYSSQTAVPLKPTPNVFITLKDQSKNEKTKDIISTSHLTIYDVNSEQNYNRFYDLQNVDRNTIKCLLYNVDNQVKIDIHVEPPEVTHQVYSYDGTLTWAIEGYRERKQMEVDGLIESYISPYFYTNNVGFGYRVLAKIRLNGFDDFEHKGVSAQIIFSEGQFDAAKPIGTYYHKVTVSVFNPTEPARNISKILEIHGKSWSRIDLGTHEEIENYLFNDTLYYNVVVKTTRNLVK